MKSNAAIISLLLTNIIGAVAAMAKTNFVVSVILMACAVYWSVKLITNKRKEHKN